MLLEERSRHRCIEVHRFAKYRDDPVGFARDVLGIDLWCRQAEIARSVAEHSSTAVRSGHKVGKSTVAGVLALWWTATREKGLVVLTSASFSQIEETLWPELSRLHKHARIDLGGELHDTPRGGLRWKDGRRIFGRSTNKSERIAGISGAEVLWIIDEASGIDETIFEAIEGNRMGGAKCLMLGNPTQTSGTFFDAFHSKREFWNPIHISSEESPNVIAGKMLVPGLAMREQIEQYARAWGKDSPKYAVRVAGNFPAQASDAVIGLALVEAATNRWQTLDAAGLIDERDIELGTLDVGVDVARYGDDDSVIFPRRGTIAFMPEVEHGQDTVQIAGKVLQVVKRALVPGEKARVRVDVIGVGAGVADILRYSDEAKRGAIEVIEVNASEEALASDEYSNVRTESWFHVKEWLKSGAIPPIPELEGELLAPKYRFDGKGRQKVEPKDDIKSRLGRSTDRADGLGLSVLGVGVTGDADAWGERRSLNTGGF
jgi:hypothetical protein